MKLNLRPAEECTFDAVSLGEVMLRLDQVKEEFVQQEALEHGKVAENITLSVVFTSASV